VPPAKALQPRVAATTDSPPTNQHDTVDAPETKTKTTVAPFHTDTDPGDPVYHDNSDCRYGQQIKANNNDKPGTDDRRRCDWCTNAATPAP
jgi:H+-transporting ATPase